MCPCRTLIILFESCVICKRNFLHESLMEKLCITCISIFMKILIFLEALTSAKVLISPYTLDFSGDVWGRKQLLPRCFAMTFKSLCFLKKAFFYSFNCCVLK